jgi:inactive STAND
LFYSGELLDVMVLSDTGYQPLGEDVSSEKYCVLTPEGVAKVKALLEQARYKPRKSGYNRSNLKAITGLDTDTLRKLLAPIEKPMDKKDLKAVHKASIDSLFISLQRKINPGVQDRQLLTKLPIYSTYWRETLPQTPAKYRSKVMRQLCHLDYEFQEGQIKEFLSQCDQAIAISLSAPCELTQKWLAHRLRYVLAPDQGKALSCPIQLLEYDSVESFDDFFEKLRDTLLPNSQAKSQALEQSYREQVFDILCNSNSIKPVVITVHTLGPEHQQAKKLLLREFWQPLIKHLSVNKKCNRLSRIVLLLVEDAQASQSLASTESWSCKIMVDRTRGGSASFERGF